MRNSVIWKFPIADLTKDGILSLDLPLHASVLTFGHDTEGTFCVWAEITQRQARLQKENPGYTRIQKFLVVPTGAEFEYDGEYVQTVFVDSGPLFGMRMVFHIYRMND